MTFDNSTSKNFQYSTVAIAPATPLAGLSLSVQPTDGLKFAEEPFWAVLCAPETQPLGTNAEIIRVTVKTGDKFTIERAQQGSVAQAVGTGWNIFAGDTAQSWLEVHTAIETNATAIAAEVTRAEAAEVANATAITTEVAARKTAVTAAEAAAVSEAGTAEANAITAATAKVATETTRAETAEAEKLAKASNLSDVADAGSSRANVHVPALTPVLAVATTNIATLSGLQAVDGVTPGSGTEELKTVLLTAQTEAKNNGLWNQAAGAWARPTEFAEGLAVKARTVAVISGSSEHAHSEWVLKTSSTVTIGTTSQTWEPLLPVSVDSTSTRNYIDAVHDFAADPSGATFSTSALKEAWEAAKAKGWALMVPLGVYKVSTAAASIFVQGGGAATPIIGYGCGKEGSSLERSVTSIVRAEGSLPIWTCTGTADETKARGNPIARDIEFNGLNTVGDLVVFTKCNDPGIDNVRFNNAQGRLCRNLQSFNGRWGKCYFTNGGSLASRFTGCKWESGANQVTVVGTIPPNVENLLVYGHGIPFGTVAKSAAGQVITLSANTTEASTATGAFTIEGAPAVSFEGIQGDGSFGSSAVNHLDTCEFEGNAGVDLDLAGSADGQAAACSLTTVVNGKQERQVATNHEPVIRERYAIGTCVTAFPMNPGGSITSATGTIKTASLNTLTLAAKNAAVAAGQQVTGLGSPHYCNLKANGVTSSKVLIIQGTIPKEGAGAVSVEGTTFSGVSVGDRVRVPGSNAITPGTTVKAILSATELELSAEPTEEIAGVDIVVGGMFVESVASEEVVTLDTNALGEHTGQTYVFGGSRTRHLVKPSYGYGPSDTILSACRLAHSGAPDTYINLDSGKLAMGPLELISDGTIPPGLAYVRVGKTVAASAVTLPSFSANSQYPLQLISDERTISGANAPSIAYANRRLPIDTFAVAGAVTAATQPEKKMGYYAAPHGSLSTITTSFLVPPDLAPGAWLYIAVRWWSKGTTGNTYWTLGGIAGLGAGNLRTQEYTEQGNVTQATGASEGNIVVSALKTKSVIGSQQLVPGAICFLAISRVGANAADTLTEPANIVSVDMYYQRA